MSKVVEEKIKEEDMTEAEIMTVLVDESTDKRNKKEFQYYSKLLTKKWTEKHTF